MEQASEASIAKRSAAEQVSGVSGASEQTQRATEWFVKNAIVCDQKRPFKDTTYSNQFQFHYPQLITTCIESQPLCHLFRSILSSLKKGLSAGRSVSLSICSKKFLLRGFLSIPSFLFGQRPQSGQSPVENKGTFVHSSICPFSCLSICSFTPPLSGLSGFSGLRGPLQPNGP